MKRKLEIVVWPKIRKGMEFKQTLDCLAGILQDYCSSLEIDGWENGEKYILLAEWDKTKKMDQMLQSNEFSILSGAIAVLCEKIDIRLDGKQVESDMANLTAVAADQ